MKYTTLVYRALFTSYIQLNSPKQKGFTSIPCPFHKDTDKSAGIDLTTGVFKCFKCGTKSAEQFIAEFNNTTVQEASLVVDAYRTEHDIKKVVDNFSKKFGLIAEPKYLRDIFERTINHPLSGTFAELYGETRGFDIDTMRDEQIGFIEKDELIEVYRTMDLEPDDYVWCADSLVFPYFYGTKLVSLRFRAEDGSKGGPNNTIMVPWGINKLTDEDSFVVMCEGESDRLKLLYEFKKQSLPIKVISPPGSYFKKEWGRDLSDVSCLLSIQQSDDAADNLKKNLTKELGTKAKFINLKWKRGQLGKDVCEWCAQNDPRNLIDDIIRAQEATESSSRILCSKEFLLDKSTEKEDDCYIKGLLYEGQVWVIAGQMKQKKSWIALNLVQCLLSPKSNFLGIPELNSTDRLPNVLYIQTEGAKNKFQDRVRKITSRTENPDKAFWWFKPGLKLNNTSDVEKLAQKIEELNIEILVADPFQRLATGDENSATEMGIVWDSIFTLLYQFPKLSIVILFHFGKDDSISERWNAIRGTSRHGGEVDGGIFVENRPIAEGPGSRVIIEARDEDQYLTPDGKDIFKMTWDADAGSLTMDFSVIAVNKAAELFQMVKEKGEWEKKEAEAYFGVSHPTMSKWVKDTKGLELTTPAPGKPVMIRYTGK